jgi:hypothetical protein
MKSAVPRWRMRNESRDWHIWSDFAALLIRRVRSRAGPEQHRLRVGFHDHRFAPKFVRVGVVSFHQGGRQDAHASGFTRKYPTFIHVSDGKMGNVNVLDVMPIEAGAFYVMDRGYLDFSRLYKMHQAGAFFVTRATNAVWTPAESIPPPTT